MVRQDAALQSGVDGAEAVHIAQGSGNDRDWNSGDGQTHPAKGSARIILHSVAGPEK